MADAATIAIWRSETLQALINIDRTFVNAQNKLAIEITNRVGQTLKDMLPKRGQQAMSLFCTQIISPTLDVSKQIACSPTDYYFRFPQDKLGTLYRDDLSRYDIRDIRSGRQVRMASADGEAKTNCLSSSDGKGSVVGECVLVVQPGFYRRRRQQGQAHEDVQLSKPVIVARLIAPKAAVGKSEC